MPSPIGVLSGRQFDPALLIVGHVVPPVSNHSLNTALVLFPVDHSAASAWLLLMDQQIWIPGVTDNIVMRLACLHHDQVDRDRGNAQ